MTQQNIAQQNKTKQQQAYPQRKKSVRDTKVYSEYVLLIASQNMKLASPSFLLLHALVVFLLLLVGLSDALVPQLPLPNNNPTTTTNSKDSKQQVNTGILCSDNKVPRELVEALDLKPLMQNVAQHAGTKRARDALLSTVEYGSFQKKKSFHSEFNRKAILFSVSPDTTTATTASSRSATSAKTTSTKHIFKMADTLVEAKKEWDLVSEAMELLEKDIPSASSSESANLSSLPLPPIYGVDSSPWSSNFSADSDDDEWLTVVLAGYPMEPLDLEQILQAEMVVTRIAACCEWARLKEIQERAPNIIQIFKRVDLDVLKNLQNELEGAVVIIRGGKSVFDPTGAKSFVFQLNESKFANISILRDKEKNIKNEIDDILQQLLASKKYVSQLSGRGKQEASLLDGRMVITVSKEEFAERIGVIRRKQDSIFYVEPKEVVKLGNDLLGIQEEIDAQTSFISNHMNAAISRAAGRIDHGLDAVARIDTIFARAAFGSTLNGCIPEIGDSGVIDVEDFIHPVLAASKRRRTVPIDLKIASKDLGERTLIISGPNGGGKSLAMKSFGLAAIMVKLGVPIPRDKSSSPYTGETRVDFFTDIFVELGDHQNLRESTYQAHLKSLSHLLERVSSPSIHSSLLLIDELGGGTDPTAGACIAQAILEKVLDNRHVRTILTTHSMQLKALAIEDNRFNSASVLLQAGDSENTRFRLPTYKLCYGTIGNSYALGAASRCDPPLPNGVLDRAASLIASSQDKRGEHMRIITEALEKEQQALSIATEVTSGYKDDIIRCRNAIVALARSYEQQFSRIESRLDGMLLTLKEDETRSAYDIVGDSLSTLRASKKYVKSKEEMLRDKGMRAMTMSDDIAAGAQVMIIGNGDFEGETATVSMDQSHAEFDEVVVDLDLDFDNEISLRQSKISVTLKKSKLAVWDYPSFDEVWGTSNPAQYDYQPVQDSQNRLQNVLSTLKNEGPKETGMTSSKEKESGSNYASSRERKAAKKKSGKKKK